MAAPIEDYALIGDCHTAALVSKVGSIDWLCLPRFDSAACFASLLGNRDNGHWQVGPRSEVQATRRRYVDDTLVLETQFETDEGCVALYDFMPPRDERMDLIRIVEGRRGCVPMRTEAIFRFDYGSIVPWVKRMEDGYVAIAGPDRLCLRTPVPLHGEALTTVGEFSVSEGQRIPFELTWSPSHLALPCGIDVDEAFQRTLEFWRTWSKGANYVGPYRDAVVRSLITLKALTYEPTGGIVAAPTTSLPERLGGLRNWDYRYCWLRDATFTLYALLSAGYTNEACAWRDWLLRAVAGSPEQMQIIYGVAGERRIPEMELGWLSGYNGATPVRIGNAASHQFQLDVFGEVMDTLHLSRRAGIPSDDVSWKLQKAFVRYVERVWTEPDYSIWEVRGPARHFTFSKVMAWVAVDRAVKAVQTYGLLGPVARWEKLRGEIHQEVCERGFDPSLNSFVQYYGGSSLDASLLLLAIVGFLPPSDERIKGTVAAIERSLTRDGLIARYVTEPGLDGLPKGEGAFVACTFWLVDNYVLLGRNEEAKAVFERLLSLANDVGLLAEQYDPVSKCFLGNFPQAFSHIALVNSARNLSTVWKPAEHRKAAESQTSFEASVIGLTRANLFRKLLPRPS